MGDEPFDSWPPMCFACGLKKADVDNATFFCAECKATKDAEQAARMKTLATLPPMDWELWARWLLYYHYDVEHDLEWAQMAFEKWGRSMPYAAVLGDYPELEHEFNYRTSQELGEQHPANLPDHDLDCDEFMAEDERRGLRRLTGTDTLV